jgi:hypothetical protein
MHRAHLFTTACLALLVAACGSDDDDASWQGETPYVDIAGELDGNQVDVSVDGASAADLTRSFCKREYTVPDAEDTATWNQAVMSELEATVRITDGGVEKEYELSLAGADLSTLAKGTTLSVIPDEGAPAAGQVVVELEWGWEEPGTGFVSYEGTATSGTVKVELFDGTPGADGKVIPDNTGKVGLTFDTAFDGGTLRGSFTLHCAENEIEAAE